MSPAYRRELVEYTLFSAVVTASATAVAYWVTQSLIWTGLTALGVLLMAVLVGPAPADVVDLLAAQRTEDPARPEPDTRLLAIMRDEPGPVLRHWYEQMGYRVVVDPACPPGNLYLGARPVMFPGPITLDTTSVGDHFEFRAEERVRFSVHNPTMNLPTSAD